MLEVWGVGMFLRRCRGMRHFFLSPVVCSDLCSWSTSWPFGLRQMFLGHCLVLWQEKALQHLSCPIATPTIVPDVRGGQLDPWSVPHCPQQGLLESCREAHAPCLGPPPSHGGVVPSHDLVVEQLCPLQGYWRYWGSLCGSGRRLDKFVGENPLGVTRMVTDTAAGSGNPWNTGACRLEGHSGEASCTAALFMESRGSSARLCFGTAVSLATDAGFSGGCPRLFTSALHWGSPAFCCAAHLLLASTVKQVGHLSWVKPQRFFVVFFFNYFSAGSIF